MESAGIVDLSTSPDITAARERAGRLVLLDPDNYFLFGDVVDMTRTLGRISDAEAVRMWLLTGWVAPFAASRDSVPAMESVPDELWAEEIFRMETVSRGLVDNLESTGRLTGVAQALGRLEAARLVASPVSLTDRTTWQGTNVRLAHLRKFLATILSASVRFTEGGGARGADAMINVVASEIAVVVVGLRLIRPAMRVQAAQPIEPLGAVGPFFERNTAAAMAMASDPRFWGGGPGASLTNNDDRPAQILLALTTLLPSVLAQVLPDSLNDPVLMGSFRVNACYVIGQQLLLGADPPPQLLAGIPWLPTIAHDVAQGVASQQRYLEADPDALTTAFTSLKKRLAAHPEPGARRLEAAIDAVTGRTGTGAETIRPPASSNLT